MLGSILAVVGDPETIGKMVGGLFWSVIALVGILKCVSIARRETTSSVCVYSLVLALVAYVLSLVLSGVKGMLLASRTGAFLVVFLAAFSVVCAIVGLTLAIVGLIGYGRSYGPGGIKREYVQGRVQARWAIAICCFYLFFFMVGLLGVQKNNMLHPKEGVSNIRKSEYVFPEKNFRLNLPDKTWVEMDAEAINPDSSMVLHRKNPELYLAVVAEQPGVEAGMTIEQLVEAAHSNLKALTPIVRFSEVVPFERNGLAGQRYAADATMGGVEVSYIYWCIANNGYCYQVMLWSARKDKEKLLAHADSLFEGFRQIAPDLRFYSSAGGAFGLSHSESFGYSIDLRNTDWCAWDTIREVDEMADRGGIHPDGTRFSMTVLALPPGEVSLAFVQQGLLEVYGTDWPLREEDSTPISVAGMEGVSYTYSNAKNHCSEQLLISSSCVYLLSAWHPNKEAGTLAERAEEIFDAVLYSPEQVMPELLDRLPEDCLSAQGTMLNQIGLAYYNAGRFPDAVDWFRIGARCDATNTTYFGNTLAAYNQMGQLPEALAWLESATDEIRVTASIRSWEASILAGSGRVEEADEIYAALFSEGYRDDEDFQKWTDLRTDNGRWDGLDDLFEEYLVPDSEAWLRVHHMDLYQKKGDYAKVVQLAQQQLESRGFSSEVAFRLIDAYQELGQNTEALAECDRLIAKGFASVDAYHEKAVSEYRLKRYRQSKETLEQALRINPRNETTQEWLQLLSAELGEGDNSCLKESIDPVEVPAELDELLAGEPPEGFGKEFGAYYARQLVLWEYEKGERLRQTRINHIKLLDEAGVSAFSSMEYSFNPVSQNIFVNRLLVRDEQGEVVARGATKDYYVINDTSDGLVSEDQKLVVPVPNLQPGYSIEVAVTRDYPNPPDEFYFKRHFLAAGFPVHHSAVWVSGEVSVLGLNGVEKTHAGEGVLWQGQEPFSYRWETMQIPVERFVPTVVLGSEGASWKACGQDYLEEIGSRLGATGEVHRIAAKLTEGCATDEAKYKAIIDHVRSAYTYKPLEFGRSAFMPDTASDTAAYRYGDCKDLSVLLMALLEVAGVEAELVLVNTQYDIYPEIATTDQFNHMIVYLPSLRGGFFVDPTDQTADAFLSVPMNLALRQALVLDPENPELKAIPKYAADSSSCTVKRTVSAPAPARLEIHDRIALTGYYASWIRSILKEKPRIKWVEWFQQNVAAFVPGLEVVSVEAAHVSDPAKELVLDLSYRLLDATHSDGKELVLDLPSIWVRHYLSVRNVQERKNPFWWNYPLNMELSVNVEPPAGYRSEKTSEESTTKNSPFIDWQSRGGGHAFQFGCRLKPGEFEASQFADFVASRNRALEAASRKVILIRLSDRMAQGTKAATKF